MHQNFNAGNYKINLAHLFSLVFIVTLFFKPTESISQDSIQYKINIKAGYNLFNEINVAGNYSVFKNLRLGLEGGFIFFMNDRKYYDMSFLNFWVPMTRQLNQTGWVLRQVLIFSTKKLKNFHSLYFEYAKLESNTYIIDDGKYSGSNSAYYAEFKEKYESVGFGYRYNILTASRKLYFNIGTCYKQRNIKRHYSLEGTYSTRDDLHSKSDRSELITQHALTFNFGVNYFFRR